LRRGPNDDRGSLARAYTRPLTRRFKCLTPTTGGETGRLQSDGDTESDSDTKCSGRATRRPSEQPPDMILVTPRRRPSGADRTE